MKRKVESLCRNLLCFTFYFVANDSNKVTPLFWIPVWGRVLLPFWIVWNSLFPTWYFKLKHWLCWTAATLAGVSQGRSDYEFWNTQSRSNVTLVEINNTSRLGSVCSVVVLLTGLIKYLWKINVSISDWTRLDFWSIANTVMTILLSKLFPFCCCFSLQSLKSCFGFWSQLVLQLKQGRHVHHHQTSKVLVVLFVCLDWV